MEHNFAWFNHYIFEDPAPDLIGLRLPAATRARSPSPSMELRPLERVAQRHLHLALAARTADHAEVRRAQRAAGIIPVHPVEGVERLRRKLIW